MGRTLDFHILTLIVQSEQNLHPRHLLNLTIYISFWSGESPLPLDAKERLHCFSITFLYFIVALPWASI